MSPDEFRADLETMQRRLLARGFDVRPLIVKPPARADELAALESRLGIGLPPSFRKLLAEYSGQVEFRWFAPDGVDYPKPFESNFGGDLHWSIDLVDEIDSVKNSWIAEVFPDADDPYDAVWHNKLAFYDVGNGDYLSIDLSPDRYEQVVYLSHDDGEGHGYVMASNILDLVRRWLPLACTGGEDWQWLPFTDSKRSLINPDSDTAKRWRWLLGLCE